MLYIMHKFIINILLLTGISAVFFIIITAETLYFLISYLHLTQKHTG
jgi:hypothetical protein